VVNDLTEVLPYHYRYRYYKYYNSKPNISKVREQHPE
jgi:hypothetical protein